MTILFWLLALVGLTFFLVAALSNAWILRLQIKAEPAGRSPSFAPIIGGLAGALGVAVLPVGTFSERATIIWLPLLLDIGCVPLLLAHLFSGTPNEPRTARPDDDASAGEIE